MLLALCWPLFGMMALAEDDGFEEFDDDPFGELDDISGYGVEQHTFGDFRCLLNEETGNIITACYIGNDTEIVVPAEIEGHKVVGIGEGTFQFSANAAAITSIILPEGIEFLGNSAFKLCQSLKEIEIPEGVVRIEYGCFGGCMALEKVVLPESLEEIDDFAFAACMKLQEVEIGPNIQRIGMQAFRLCSGLRRVVLKRDGVDIADDAFDECSEDLVFEEPAEE